ncbi:MAG: aldehyde dehydrogenase family protein, partial [Pseudomonas sp.]
MSDITLLPAVTAFMARQHGVFIHGQHIASQSSSTFGVVNPANGETIAHIADANQADVDHAVRSARQGFTTWSRTSPAARAAVLFKLADL